MILRIEHRDTKRLYERTFYDRDFAEVIVLGGLEFVGKVVAATIASAAIKDTTTEVNFTLAFTHELLPKPLTLNFQVPAVKREKASADIEGLLARLKKMETALTLCKELSERVQELEERCGDTITLPGCDYAIPVDVENLILVRNWAMLPDGRRFSSFHPGFYHQHEHSWGEFNPLVPYYHPNQNQPQSTRWSLPENLNEKAIVFNNITSVHNLKYCKKLRDLTICGAPDLQDYSMIGNLKGLTNIRVLANSRSTQKTNPVNGQNVWTYSAKDNHPLITDISWISNLKNLQKVSFQGCTNLVNIAALKDLPNLTEVDLRDTAVKNTGFLASSKLTIII